jgi:hypothetical protein
VFSTINDDPSKHVHADALLFVGEDGGVISTTTEDPSQHVQPKLFTVFNIYHTPKPTPEPQPKPSI